MSAFLDLGIVTVISRNSHAPGQLLVDLALDGRLSEPDIVTVSVNDVVMINNKNLVFRTLLGVFKKIRYQRLKDLPHQGKTAHCFGVFKSSSHFLNEGKFMSFKQWRFIHKARLCLVSLNAYKHGSGPWTEDVEDVAIDRVAVKKLCLTSLITV